MSTPIQQFHRLICQDRTALCNVQSYFPYKSSHELAFVRQCRSQGIVSELAINYMHSSLYKDSQESNQLQRGALEFLKQAFLPKMLLIGGVLAQDQILPSELTLSRTAYPI